VTITPEQHTYARLAGILFLANYVLQCLGDFPTILARRGETFAETARWAAESQLLYRVSLLEVAAAWIVIGILAFALYAVLEPVNKRLAQLALMLRLGASFVGASSVMLRMAEARLYRASATEGLFTTEQLHTLVTVSVRSYSAGVKVAWMFMGAGSLLFFMLFWRSRYLPRALAGLGILGSGLVVVMAATMFVFPDRTNELKLIGLLPFLAEVTTALWLLFKGLQPQAMAEARA
jgi:uncharacterized protein DUF4386